MTSAVVVAHPKGIKEVLRMGENYFEQESSSNWLVILQHTDRFCDDRPQGDYADPAASCSKEVTHLHNHKF